jgi:RNA polymerase sigma factor (TIGR02999 family)
VGSSICSFLEVAESAKGATADALFSSLYSELHRLAKSLLSRQSGFMTVSATTLIHQAYIDIAENTAVSFPDRNRFLGYAARVMRGLIIDHARNRTAQKRGGLFEITSLATDSPDNSVDHRELILISDALDELAQFDAPLAEMVDLKFFCGFSFVEIAGMRQVSERTVQREWEKVRIYLHRSIRPDLCV